LVVQVEMERRPEAGEERLPCGERGDLDLSGKPLRPRGRQHVEPAEEQRAPNTLRTGHTPLFRHVRDGGGIRDVSELSSDRFRVESKPRVSRLDREFAGLPLPDDDGVIAEQRGPREGHARAQRRFTGAGISEKGDRGG
jgi:hypothetical protein